MTQNQEWPKIKNEPKSKMTKTKNDPNKKMTQIQNWPKIKNYQKPKMSQIQKWPKIKSRSDATALRAEGAQADVRSALHSPDHPPFFVFLSFSCFYIYCGSMCSMGSMWAQQSYSAVLHLHLWWYYCLLTSLRSVFCICIWIVFVFCSPLCGL